MKKQQKKKNDTGKPEIEKEQKNDNDREWVMGDKMFYVLLIFGILMMTYFLHSSFSERSTVIEPQERVNSFEECAAKGYSIAESYPRQCITPNGQVFAEDIGNITEKEDLIRVDNITANQIVYSPLNIKGEARGYWFFEGDFPVKILDANNNILGTGIASALSEWMTEDFVPFEATIKFDPLETEKGFVVLEKDNPSGLEQYADELKIPVNFAPKEETMTVKVFFNNHLLDPDISCTKVFAAERVIPKTKGVANATITELLKGVTEEEILEGYATSINEGVKINSLVIENGVAKIDFDEQLEYQVGGSCMVSSIRAQIEETLEQFDTIDEVIISINGRTEDVLQP